MKKYEFFSLVGDVSYDRLGRITHREELDFSVIDDLGQEGWQLAGYHYFEGKLTAVIMQREVPEESPLDALNTLLAEIEAMDPGFTAKFRTVLAGDVTGGVS